MPIYKHEERGTEKEVSKKQINLEIVFKDSYRFLGSSIDMLAKSLLGEDFKNLNKHFSSNNELLRRKGKYS